MSRRNANAVPQLGRGWIAAAFAGAVVATGLVALVADAALGDRARHALEDRFGPVAHWPPLLLGVAMMAGLAVLLAVDGRAVGGWVREIAGYAPPRPYEAASFRPAADEVWIEEVFADYLGEPGQPLYVILRRIEERCDACERAFAARWRDKYVAWLFLVPLVTLATVLLNLFGHASVSLMHVVWPLGISTAAVGLVAVWALWVRGRALAGLDDWREKIGTTARMKLRDDESSHPTARPEPRPTATAHYTPATAPPSPPAMPIYSALPVDDDLPEAEEDDATDTEDNPMKGVMD